MVPKVLLVATLEPPTSSRSPNTPEFGEDLLERVCRALQNRALPNHFAVLINRKHRDGRAVPPTQRPGEPSVRAG